MACDVFEENPSGLNFADDPSNVGPQMALVVFAPALSCMAERLARVSGKDGVDCSAQDAAIECCDIIPNRGGGEVSATLCGNDPLAGVFVPFDKASGVGTRLGQHEAHIKATGARAK